MLRQTIRDFIKYNKMFYKAYRFCGSILIRFLSLFIPVNKKKIFFISFGGRKYDDSPKNIYEKMLQNDKFKDYTFVWALTDLSVNVPGKAICVKTDSFSYYYHCLSSRFWITNVSAERGLDFKTKKNICINTWHGTPLKKICGEENVNSQATEKYKKNKFDLICAQSEYDQNIFSRIFKMDKSDVILCDLPRNDDLVDYDINRIDKIKANLGIPADKKVILYMPTYREYLRDNNNSCYLAPPINLKKWEDELGKEYILLVRAHYLVAKELDISENDFVFDVSKYDCLNDLYIIADLLISDYSSAFFDFAILMRPVFCFAYDLEEYQRNRGLYVNLNEALPCLIDNNEDDLIEHIKVMDYKKMCENTKKFKEKYLPFAGNSSETLINEIISRYIT